MDDRYEAQYESILSDFINHQGLNDELASGSLSRDDIENSEEFQAVLEGLKSGDTSSDGEMAEALVAIGRREPDWDWPVGETPDEA